MITLIFQRLKKLTQLMQKTRNSVLLNFEFLLFYTIYYLRNYISFGTLYFAYSPKSITTIEWLVWRCDGNISCS